MQNFEDLLLAGKASNIKNNWFNISREDEIFIQKTEELNSLQNESSIYCQSSRMDLLPSYPFSISQSLSRNRAKFLFSTIFLKFYFTIPFPKVCFIFLFPKFIWQSPPLKFILPSPLLNFILPSIHLKISNHLSILIHKLRDLIIENMLQIIKHLWSNLVIYAADPTSSSSSAVIGHCRD